MGRVFRNWAHNVAFEAERYVRPKSVEELSDVVRSAKQLRVVGRGHSFNRALDCRDTVVSLEHMKRVLHVDRDAGTVTVEAGMRLSELNERLEREGLSISSPGDVDYQSIGGLISTASHGSNLSFCSLSDFVRKLTIVDGEGRVRELSASDGSLFRAASVGIGLCGVVQAVTLACEPLFHLRKIQSVVSLDEAFEKVARHAAKAEPGHLELWYFPFTDRVFMIEKERIAPAESKGISLMSRISLVLIENYTLQAVLELCALVPRLVPRLMSLLAKLAGGPPESDVAYRIYRTARLFRAIDCEVAVPFESAREAIERLKRCVEAHAKRSDRRYYLHCPVNVRFVAPSHQGLLNPAFGRRTCYVDVSTYPRFKGHEGLFEDFERELAELGGRPHWGKVFATNPLSRYPSDNVRQFREARRELDPGEKFVNPFLRERLPELF